MFLKVKFSESSLRVLVIIYGFYVVTETFALHKTFFILEKCNYRYRYRKYFFYGITEMQLFGTFIFKFFVAIADVTQKPQYLMGQNLSLYILLLC